MVLVDDEKFVMKDGIFRAAASVSGNQQQTRETFGYKWQKRETFESRSSLTRMREWLLERYGDICNAVWWREYDDYPLVLDAGCGAAMSAIELLGERIGRVRYLGVDISEAIDVGAARFMEHGLDGAFLQTDISRIPLPEFSVDVIFSEGVLHHTDSTEKALKILARMLKPGGRFMFYVYNRKGPVREFTDDYIRSRLQSMSPEQGWQSMIALSRLGKILGDLDIVIDISEPIDLLDIPAGEINLQRFFYWHIMKIFYRDEMTLDEMNHINFDWYAPANAHRQTPEEVEKWCEEADLSIERKVVEPAGITMIGRRQG
jgi:SAM-dependent methyltransferase